MFHNKKSSTKNVFTNNDFCQIKDFANKSFHQKKKVKARSRQGQRKVRATNLLMTLLIVILEIGCTMSHSGFALGSAVPHSGF